MNVQANKVIYIIKNYPLSLTAVMAISVATFASPDTPALLSKFDKIVHFLMYAVLCSIFWHEYFRRRERVPAIATILIAVTVPTVLGGLLELFQSLLTANRKCDIFDFIFNTLGVLFALFASLIKKCRLI